MTCQQHNTTQHRNTTNNTQPNVTQQPNTTQRHTTSQNKTQRIATQHNDDKKYQQSTTQRNATQRNTREPKQDNTAGKKAKKSKQYHPKHKARTTQSKAKQRKRTKNDIKTKQIQCMTTAHATQHNTTQAVHTTHSRLQHNIFGIFAVRLQIFCESDLEIILFLAGFVEVFSLAIKTSIFLCNRFRYARCPALESFNSRIISFLTPSMSSLELR